MRDVAGMDSQIAFESTSLRTSFLILLNYTILYIFSSQVLIVTQPWQFHNNRHGMSWGHIAVLLGTESLHAAISESW